MPGLWYKPRSKEGLQEALIRMQRGAIMVHNSNHVYLIHTNTRGADFEGLRGAHNTFIHSALWYLARCWSFRNGIDGTMIAKLVIDDGAFGIKMPKAIGANSEEVIRRDQFSLCGRPQLRLHNLGA